MPAISVLLVTYNAGPYLRESVGSILGQTERDLELLLIDNASTDDSVRTVMEEFGSDKRLQLIPSDTNRRHYGGLVFGMPHVTGEFVAIMDADDIARPERFALQRAVLQRDPSVGMVATQCQRIDSQGREYEIFRTVYPHEDVYGDTQFFCPLRHPTYFFRRTVLEDIPYRADFPTTGDHDILSRVVEKYRVLALPLPLLKYRMHEATTTSRQSGSQVAFQSVVRLATWRRRHGKAENIDELLTLARNLVAKTQDSAEILAAMAETMYSEGFYSGAILNLKQAYARKKSLGTIGGIGRALARGFATRGDARQQWLRQMWDGPSKALMICDGLPRDQHFI